MTQEIDQIARFETKEEALAKAIQSLTVREREFIEPKIFWIGPGHTGIYKVPAAGWYAKIGKSFLIEGE